MLIPDNAFKIEIAKYYYLISFYLYTKLDIDEYVTFYSLSVAVYYRV